MKPIPLISAASEKYGSFINMLHLKGSIRSCLSWNELIYKATEAKNMKQNDIWQRAKNSIFAFEVINYSLWNRFHWYLQRAKSMAASFMCFIWRDLSCLSCNELIYKATEAKNMKQNDIWQSAKNSIFACEVIKYSVWNRFHWYLQQAKSMAASLICWCVGIYQIMSKLEWAHL